MPPLRTPQPGPSAAGPPFPPPTRPRPGRGAWPFALLLLALAAGPARADEDRKFDVVHLKNGHTLRGLLDGQTGDELQFRDVRSKPGSSTHVFRTTLKRDEVQSLELLDDKDRAELKAWLDSLDPSGKREADRVAGVKLTSVPWGKGGQGGKAWRYESARFVLESNASPDIVRRAAVRLEEIFAAYERFLPPRQQSVRRTTILLVRSRADYQGLLKEQGRALLNPAFYDVECNRIVCGTDLQRLGEQLEQARDENQQLLAEAAKREGELVRLFKGRDEIPPYLLRPIQELRAKVDAVNKQNDEQFHAATQQMFPVLYHEAFHAYLANDVYPADEAEVPRWLNEGLAQIFETAFVEGGQLRVGHADKERRREAQKALARGELVPLTDLLRSRPGQFLVKHAGDQETSDRYYLTSWAVAFYLTFDRRLLGTPAMDGYVRALHGGADPVAAFERLTGEPVSQFEKEFQQYLAELREDGTVGHKAPPR